MIAQVWNQVNKIQMDIGHIQIPPGSNPSKQMGCRAGRTCIRYNGFWKFKFQGSIYISNWIFNAMDENIQPRVFSYDVLKSITIKDGPHNL